ncbi:MAG: T9SS type A sorting domain-containing protein [Bacteroidia bacterium]
MNFFFRRLLRQSASLMLCCLFYSVAGAQQITAMEYFFDNDPGTGNATQIIIPSPADTITKTATINTTGLQGGNHVLFVRTKLANGFWSLYEPREFFIKPNIIGAEYFFDSDPGVGNGISFAVTPAFDLATFISTINTTGLPGGNHTVFIRTKDETGKWSLYQPREFFIKPNIIAAEYFFDTDPGVGNGISISIAPAFEPATFISTINTAGLPGGNHIVFIRTKDESGKWSLYQPREFYIKTNIIAAEYFIDTDPGVGNAIPLVINTLSDTVSIDSTITTGLLPYGTHYIFVRTKDARNVWSLYEPHEFTVTDPLPVEWLSFNAERKNTDALLTWVTGSEKNCLRFDVERMIPENGTAFYKIGEVPGNGNASAIHQYYFTDSNVKCKGACYYRIRQIDLNGNFIFSKIVAVNFDKEKTFIKLYPNPSSQYFTLDVTGESEDVLSVEIINSNGQLVSSYSNLSFPYRFGNDLKAGTYFVAIKKLTETLRFKIVKTK